MNVDDDNEQLNESESDNESDNSSKHSKHSCNNDSGVNMNSICDEIKKINNRLTSLETLIGTVLKKNNSLDKKILSVEHNVQDVMINVEWKNKVEVSLTQLVSIKNDIERINNLLQSSVNDVKSLKLSYTQSEKKVSDVLNEFEKMKEVKEMGSSGNEMVSKIITANKEKINGILNEIKEIKCKMEDNKKQQDINVKALWDSFILICENEHKDKDGYSSSNNNSNV